MVACRSIITCYNCGKRFEGGQYVYQVKLNDGGVKYSHGYPCIDLTPISEERLSMRDGDWWAKTVGIVCETCGSLVEG